MQTSEGGRQPVQLPGVWSQGEGGWSRGSRQQQLFFSKHPYWSIIASQWCVSLAVALEQEQEQTLG